MTQITTFNYFVGDVVRDIVTGELYEVKKLMPKNARCQATDGKLWNIDQRRLVVATTEQAAEFKEHMVDVLLDGATFRLGTVCCFKNVSKPDQKGLFIVTKSKAEGVSLAFLGGHLQNRYWPTVPTALLERVDGVITVTNVG